MREKEFTFVCAPQNGERFLSEEAKEQIKLWSAPWKIIN